MRLVTGPFYVLTLLVLGEVGGVGGAVILTPRPTNVPRPRGEGQLLHKYSNCKKAVSVGLSAVPRKKPFSPGHRGGGAD